MEISPKISERTPTYIDLNDNFFVLSTAANHSRVFPRILVNDWLAPKIRKKFLWNQYFLIRNYKG